MIFLKVARNDIFEFPDHLRQLRNEISLLKLDFRAQKIDFSAFAENRELEPKTFANDDFAPSNSKFSLLSLRDSCFWTWCEALSSILTLDLEPG